MPGVLCELRCALAGILTQCLNSVDPESTGVGVRRRVAGPPGLRPCPLPIFFPDRVTSTGRFSQRKHLSASFSVHVVWSHKCFTDTYTERVHRLGLRRLVAMREMMKRCLTLGLSLSYVFIAGFRRRELSAPAASQPRKFPIQE